ncbi:MAG: TrkA family potassium uptake protein [Spirochaetales bacterium]|nr:TrkA family potassium uptake protein [Spirochaetales bacterium]
MKQIAVIGLGEFGKRMIDELSEFDTELLIIDKDESLVDQFKHKVTISYVADISHESTLRRLVPVDVDIVIVDLGKKIENSVLATINLKKIGIKKIIVRAENEHHGEILKLVGATRIIFPAKEAAQRISPILLSADLFSYFPINDGLFIAEIRVPAEYRNRTLVESDLRNSHNITVIAAKRKEEENFSFITRDFRMTEESILLVAGVEKDLMRFSGIQSAVMRSSASPSLRKLFSKTRK